MTWAPPRVAGVEVQDAMAAGTDAEIHQCQADAAPIGRGLRSALAAVAQLHHLIGIRFLDARPGIADRNAHPAGSCILVQLDHAAIAGGFDGIGQQIRGDGDDVLINHGSLDNRRG